MHTPHESPWVVTAAAGAAGHSVGGDRLHDHPADAVRRFLQGRDLRRRRAATRPWPRWPSISTAHAAMALHGLRHAALLAGAGRRVVTAWWFYLKQPPSRPPSAARWRPLVKVLENKYYMDWFNEHVLAAGARLWARACGRAATGPDRRRCWSTARPRWWAAWPGCAPVQTGRLYTYALVMLLGVFALLTWQLWPYFSGLR
jgi:NADH-quinone oxidoreductase subunit L